MNVAWAIDRCRSRVRGMPWLLRACRRGLNRAVRSVYESLLLRRGIHEKVILGCRLRFVVGTHDEIVRIDGLAGEYEYVARMLACLQHGDVVWDVGANIGVISLLLVSARPDLDVEVHAFEPEPRNAAHLRRNLQLNPRGSRVHVHEVALSDRAGAGTLFVRGAAGCGAHSLTGKEGEACIEIALETGDGIAERLGRAPNVVKIDVEGAEMSVLKGMEIRLGQGRVRDLFIEVHPEKLRDQRIEPYEVESWLAERNMSLQYSHMRGNEQHHHFARLCDE